MRGIKSWIGSYAFETRVVLAVAPAFIRLIGLVFVVAPVAMIPLLVLCLIYPRAWHVAHEFLDFLGVSVEQAAQDAHDTIDRMSEELGEIK